MTYFSVDVETTGLNPLLHDVTSLSIVEVVTERHFSCRITEPLVGWRWDRETKLWCEKNIPASVAKLPLYTPSSAVIAINNFIEDFAKPSNFVAWPASFDYPFLQGVYIRAALVDTWPFHYRTVDVKSMMMGKLSVDINVSRDVIGSDIWLEPEDPHNPYSDALAQALTFKKLWNNGHD